MWLSLPLIFILVTLVMMASAAGVARAFATFRPLHAYRLDIIGSILGIILFTIASILRLPPVAWVLAVALLFGATIGRRATPVHWVALGLAIALLGVQWQISGDIWSPYYRVDVEARQRDGRTPIFVNGSPHQSIWTLEDLVREQPFYGYPYRHIPDNPLDEVLIVGAGSGNDVALALARGAGHVDAVEIDPVLQGLGRERHPNRPYQDPRVRAHVEDGRAFLERSDRRYDLILFALPDSLVLVAGQGSLRLESFLFTREAFEAVRSHLKPEGAFSMYNYYRPDVFARYAATLTEVFGSRPCLDVGEPGAGANYQAVLTISAQPDVLECSTFWVPPRVVPRLATDDYPFPYAQGWGLSTFYVVSLALLLLGSAFAIRRFGHVEMADARRYLDLFFMGAAFLLLETKSIVQFALLFGTTWLVNSLVFAGILISVLLAIEVAERVKRLRPGLLYSALLVSLGVAWFVRPEQLLGLSPVTRFVAATTITFAPIFFANLIFAERFRSVGFLDDGVRDQPPRSHPRRRPRVQQRRPRISGADLRRRRSPTPPPICSGQPRALLMRPMLSSLLVNGTDGTRADRPSLQRLGLTPRAGRAYYPVRPEIVNIVSYCSDLEAKITKEDPMRRPSPILRSLGISAIALLLAAPVASAAPSRPPATAFVRVNQVGYPTNLPKRAYLMSSAAETGATFQLLNAADAVVVQRIGRLLPGFLEQRVPVRLRTRLLGVHDGRPVPDPGDRSRADHLALVQCRQRARTCTRSPSPTPCPSTGTSATARTSSRPRSGPRLRTCTTRPR